MSRRKQRGACPRHGDKFMASEGAAYYCAAPTPGELTKKCFYHPVNHPKETKKLQMKMKEEAKGKPDLWKVLQKEWELHKKSKVINRDKGRIRAREKRLLAY